jgi:hypothetical protein
MIGRLITGAFIGVLIGLALAAALVKVAGVVTVWPIVAYALAALVGALTGLFAGKPIWAAGGQIEAGLKAFFGALLAAGAMFVLRTWVKVDVDLSRFGAGVGALGEVPAAALPIIAGVLGALFGIDNTPEAPGSRASEPAAKSRVRVEKGSSGARARAGGAAASEDEREELAASRRARR